MKSTTGGQHAFAKTPRADIPRSAFNRSCGVKTTFDAGRLIPVFVDEALPGDTINLRLTSLARLGTMLKVPMDNMFLDTFFFSVPNRLLWVNWEKFNGAQDDPGDLTDFEIPKVEVNCGLHDIGDYMGLPVGNDVTVSALPGRAMTLIWNDWFRDENLQDSIVMSTADAGDLQAIYEDGARKRGKRHDYFTSCLPWPQKGPSVELPLGTVAPVVPTSAGIPGFTVNSVDVGLQARGGDTVAAAWSSDPGAATGASWDFSGLETDLTNATAATINQLREAFQIQKLYERDARGGTRYTEILRSHFGVVSPDQRLQRPEFLGGGTTMVNISQVAVNADVGAPVPGDLAAFGTVSSSHGFTKSFVEHCTIIGLVCLRADLNYQEGLNRMWSRTTRWDFYWPALAQIGEQAVLNQELLYQDVPGTGATDDQGVFGYQERYAEYRFKPSQITGKFRSSDPATLDIWHLAQDFNGVLPALDEDFIFEIPPVDRILAVPSEPHMLYDGYFQFKHVRPMPTYGVPGMIDHF